AANGLGDVLNAVIGKFENQLAGLDLGQIEHVIDESEQMLTVGLKTLEYAQHLLGWLTGSSSPGDELMTRSTSAVAVCCSNDSLRSAVRCRNSLSSRVFSMAMTAWAAKFSTSSICFSVNGRTSWR